MNKRLYFDTETTGLNSRDNDIIQIAGIIEIDGKQEDEFNLKMQPFRWDTISQEACDIHGISVEQMKGFPEPKSAYKLLSNILGRYCNKYDRIVRS